METSYRGGASKPLVQRCSIGFTSRKAPQSIALADPAGVGLSCYPVIPAHGSDLWPARGQAPAGTCRWDRSRPLLPARCRLRREDKKVLRPSRSSCVILFLRRCTSESTRRAISSGLSCGTTILLGQRQRVVYDIRTTANLVTRLTENSDGSSP
jgi:hypothetical protein